MKARPSIARILCTVLLAIFAVAALAMGVTVTGLNTEVQRVRSLTPTPLPQYGSVFKVTPDPSAPTAEPVMRTGATGEAVTRLQNRLKELGYYTGTVDGQFGQGTKMAVTQFQQRNGLQSDGVVGPDTNVVLYSSDAKPAVTDAPTAVPTPTPDTSSTAAVQQRLKDLGYYTGTVDGISGPNTKAAVTLFQKQHGLKDDGICGPATSSLLFSDQAHTVQVTPTPDPSLIPGLMASGYPILVNGDNYIPDQYQTVCLITLKQYCDSSVVTIKGSDIQGEKMAVDALMDMLRAAQAEGLGKWQVNAGYRSVQYQKELFDNKVYALRQEGYSGSQARAKVRQTVADPGASEHHTGLAFDLAVTGAPSFATTKQSAWLSQHCWEYGFIIRYPADKTSITKFSYEPWHIRYVGTAHSLIMRDENLCLEEYIAKYAK
ncbi:MAG: peptidoglycan-binding protein [Clostridiales bacterium]|nr:peptidoglycan-binding protein [Clostridiales bacterium]